MSSFRRIPETRRPGLELGPLLGFVLSFGLLLVLAGAAIDTAYHLWWSGQGRFDDVGFIGHLVTLAGMVVTMVGVLAVGLRCSRPRTM